MLCLSYVAVIVYITSFLVRADIELSENVYFKKVNLGKTFFMNKLKSDGPLFYSISGYYSPFKSAEIKENTFSFTFF